MTWLVARMKWIMLLSGVLTCTMIHAAIAPQAALDSMFGGSLQGPIAEIVVRSWGALIALVGVMLIHGAFNPQSRPLVLTLAALGKSFFIALVLVYGRQFLGHQVGVAIALDSVMVLLFLTYLVAWHRGQT